MITIKQGILIFAGMTLRSMDIRTLEHVKTNVTRIPIQKPFSTALVTAKEGQVPNTKTE
jgi:hypothetical protein